ncbi:uncharacterized protein BO88DRAFT_400468 [Aspergillus vadensis CBS 113365]|uniref:Uncharacterized protein n=1 Tax=Aspergillus vadensis (strain CBS 113365 / IMI 142717 / IBT 24658) TaxID=1448311 RepID=A0A319BQ17_ASPVC|nr:hypothetical protein BO88DRAFT_400468 [Aspergillus vadensis CBS 113365]PYH74795.1 hypothetical protein BO88DRAFT_400468 [Aspergillus vadensis CBS 113365]
MSGTTQTSSSTTGRDSRPTYERRYGRKYLELDDLQDSSVCHRKVGKARADCRLRTSQSKWGCLGEASRPAGIVYMDLSFDQPADCRLLSATVKITLQGTPQHQPDPNKPVRLHLTDHYGPKYLSGEPKSVVKKRILHLAPQVTVLGNGGGGIGVDSEKSITYDSRWTFTGNLRPAQKPGSEYRTIKWELREEDPEFQSIHSNMIRTAFAFQHEGRPFFMRVQIKGKLQKGRDRFKEKVRQLRFPSRHESDEGSSDILVYPNVVAQPSGPRLDRLVQDLPMVMERENCLRIPVQIPAALPISFAESNENISDTAQSMLEDSCIGSLPGLLPNPGDSGHHTETARSSGFNSVSSSETLMDVGESCDAGDPVDACISKLGHAVHTFRTPQAVDQEGLQASRIVLHANSSLVAPAKANGAAGPRNSKESENTEGPEKVLVLLLRYPSLITFIQILAALLDFFGMRTTSTRLSG